MAETDILLRIRAIAEMSDAAEAAAEVKKLAAQVDNLQEEAAKVGTGMPAATGATKNMGMAALQSAQFIDDMQYGMKGIVNNIPTLVMSLGGSMGLAGAIGIAGVAITQLVNWLGKAKDGATDAADATAGLADKIKEVAENAAANTQDEIDKQREARDLARERAQILAKPDSAGADARAQAEAKSLANAMQVIEASETLATLMGKQIDQLEAINRREEIHEAQRLQAAQREIAAELAKAEAARAAADSARQERADADDSNKAAAEKVVNLQRQLETLRQQRDEMKAMATVSPGSEVVGNIMARSYGVDVGPVYGVAEKAREASEKLTGVEAQIAGIEGKIVVWEKQFDRTASETAKLDNAVTAAQKTADESIGAAQIKIDSITETLAASDFKAKADTAATTAKELTKNAEEFLRTVETDGKKLNQWQQEAKEDMAALLKTGGITADETGALYSSMQTLMNSTNTSFERLHELQMKADKMMRDISVATAALQREQVATKATVEDLRLRNP